MQTNDEAQVRVWDPLIRAFHWTLVIAFFTAYLTEDDLLTTHTWAGYVVGAVIALRVVWGLIGPWRARFSDFLYPPWQVVRYALDMVRLRPGRRYLGHSPAGGVMVIALLLALGVTVWSGMEVLAREQGTGPLASIELSILGTPALADEEYERDEEGDAGGERAGGEFWEETHEVAANLTLALVALHIVGVLLASVAHRENLVISMFTGRKRRNRGHDTQ